MRIAIERFTAMANRLMLLMESRIHGNMYVRFGGRSAETCCRKAVRRRKPSLLIQELEKAAQQSGLNLNVPSESKQVGLSVFYKRSKLMKRVFEDKHYLFPIPQTEIDKNKNLIQNHGW